MQRLYKVQYTDTHAYQPKAIKFLSPAKRARTHKKRKSTRKGEKSMSVDENNSHAKRTSIYDIEEDENEQEQEVSHDSPQSKDEDNLAKRISIHQRRLSFSKRERLIADEESSNEEQEEKKKNDDSPGLIFELKSA